MAEFRAWATQWSDVINLAGLALTLIGFAITIFGVWRSKGAAEQARDAAMAARETIAHYDVVADLSSAMAIMDEIKRHQRHGAWTVLPDRYATLRRRLVAIKGSQADLSDTQRQTLQGSIETFADLERRVERAVSVGHAPPNPPKFNEIVSAQIDEVHAVLLSLRRTLRSES